MFSIINNLIGVALLVCTVMFSGWSWWVSIPAGLVLMTIVPLALGILKNRITAPKTA